jgi:hypothetical protein
VYNPKLGRWLNRDPIDDPTFAMMPGSPEPRNPSDILMNSAYGQPMLPVNPVASVLTPIIKQTNDPTLRRQLAAMIPRTAGTRTLGTNLYEYAANGSVANTWSKNRDEL